MSKLGTALRNEKGYYLDMQGNEVPSVSKVKDVLNKDFLKFWAAKLVATEAVDNLTDVYRVLRVDGRDKAIKRLTRTLFQSNAAAIRGTDLHDLAERHVNGDAVHTELVDPEVRRMLNHYIQFLSDFDVQVEEQEIAMLNDTLGYAGTADIKAKIPSVSDQTVILDIKTGKGVYAEYALQLAAYANMEYKATEDGWRRLTDSVDRSTAVIVHISPEGYEVIKVDDLEIYWELFTHCRALVDFVHVLKPADIYTSLGEGASTEIIDDLSDEIKSAGNRIQLNYIYRKAVAEGTFTAAHLPLFQSKASEFDAS